MLSGSIGNDKEKEHVWVNLKKPMSIFEMRRTKILKAGMVLLTSEGKTILVGNVNVLGGECDDCEWEGIIVSTRMIDYL